MLNILFNIFLFIFGLLIGVICVIKEAVDKGFMVYDKKGNVAWIKTNPNKKEINKEEEK